MFSGKELSDQSNSHGYIGKHLKASPTPTPEQHFRFNPTQLTEEQRILLSYLFNQELFPYIVRNKCMELKNDFLGKRYFIVSTHDLLCCQSGDMVRYEIIGDKIAQSASFDPKVVFKSAGSLTRKDDGTYVYEVASRVIKRGSDETSAQNGYKIGRCVSYLNTQKPIVTNVGQRRYVFLIEDYIQGNTLLEIINNRMLFSTNDKLILIINLIMSVINFHAAGIIHRDIKPDNVIVNDNLKTFLIDCDLSKFLDEDDRNFYGGTPNFTSGEIFLKQGTNIKTDIAGVARVAHLLLNGRQSNITQHNRNKLSLVKREAVFPAFLGLLKNIPDLTPKHAAQIKQLFFAMTRLERDERVTPEEALRGFERIYEERTKGRSLIERPKLKHMQRSVSVSDLGVFSDSPVANNTPVLKRSQSFTFSGDVDQRRRSLLS